MKNTASYTDEVNLGTTAVTTETIYEPNPEPANTMAEASKPKRSSTAARKKDKKKAGAKPKTGATKDAGKATSFRPGSKAEIILKKLQTSKGATITQLVEATGWQNHSVRGFLSGTVKKKLGFEIASEPGKDGVRRYRIANIKSERRATENPSHFALGINLTH